MPTDTVRIFDTTLRDGEQSPGIALNAAEKVEIARQLERLGVDIIEAGFAISSPGEIEGIRAVSHAVDCVVASLARTNDEDIDAAIESLDGARNPRIHTFIATSDIHLRHKLRMTREQVIEAAGRAVARAKRFTGDVEFSCEDATRTDIDFMAEVVRVAIAAGATTINIPDTVGYTVPEEYTEILTGLRERVPELDGVVLSVHCHNDLGLAVANSMAGVMAGARQVECTINGIGERAGNAALEEVVMAIRTRRDHFGEVDVNTRSEELARTSRMVARLTGYHVQYNKAVVGRNAFAHEAGIHQHGVLADRETYEIIDASSVGQEAAQIVLGKHSGRHAFADTLEKMGIHVQGDALNSAFVRFKELADKKIEITEADLEAIVAEELGVGAIHRFNIAELDLRGGTVGKPLARVLLDDAERGKIEATGTGDGMIDAAIAAISHAAGVEGELTSFQVQSVTGGSDALGAVVLTLVAEGRKVTGRGVATDVVEASARAYLNAVNKIARLRGSGDRDVEVGP